jgi:putative membrane protein
MFGAQVPLNWVPEPSIILGVLLVTGAYLGAITVWRGRFAGSAPVPRGRIVAFLLGMLTILLALITPIADLSDYYLFSAHMVEHLLVTLVAPPLMLIGLPGWMIRPVFRRWPVLLRIGRVLTNPLSAFAIFNVIFIGYHLPRFYDISLASQYAHAAFHIAFIVTALLTWWPILSPLEELPPLSPPLQMVYLFAQTLPSQVLGALLTFTGRPLYDWYITAPRVWDNLTPQADQQLGGLIMWVIGGTFFLAVFAFVFLRWVAVNEAKDRRSARAMGRAR